ncbi:hypothetical protein K523DRAFT_73382 [Schizophyllum commune Tattone D]|nr:hypothetical protein K523DRAFT_73382 [Schizophyllum commune Tattone D]
MKVLTSSGARGRRASQSACRILCIVRAGSYAPVPPATPLHLPPRTPPYPRVGPRPEARDAHDIHP